MKKIMRSVTTQMRAQDNAAVITVGNNATINPFAASQEETQAQIDRVGHTNENTNLYASITTALDILNTDSRVNTKKCLIILSDGKDYYTKGYTREEVDCKIQNMHLPVYTISMLNAKSNPETVESAKILGSFARLSAGGLDIVYGLEKLSAENIANNIKQSILDSYILTADLSGAQVKNDQCYLELTFTVPNSGKAVDGYIIPSAKIMSATHLQTEKAASSSAVSTEISSPLPAQSGSAISLWIVFAITAACAAIILLMIFFYRKSKKLITGKAPDSLQQKDLCLAGTQTDLSQELDPIQKAEVHFVQVGPSEEKSYSFLLSDELIIGRDVSKAQLVFPNDELLSGSQCKITRKDNQFYLIDLNSTNGTYVNGVPVNQTHLLEKDDIILIGSMELRIYWL